jgi:hypothetical protein
MSLSEKIVTELVEAIQALTPDKIKAAATARASALKLTETEQKLRDEAVAIIDSVSVKTKELEKKQAAYDSAVKVYNEGIDAYELDMVNLGKEQSIVAAQKQEVESLKTEYKTKLKDLADSQSKLDKLIVKNENAEKSLQIRENAIAEKESIFSGALQKVASK